MDGRGSGLRKASVAVLLLTILLIIPGCTNSNDVSIAQLFSLQEAVEASRGKIEELEMTTKAMQEEIRDLTRMIEQRERAERERQIHLRRRLDFSNSIVDGATAVVYYWDVLTSLTTLQPVVVKVSRDKDRLRAAIEALIEGAPAAGLSSGLGAAPRLLSATTENGLAVLDFDEHFYDFKLGGSFWTSAVRASLTYTATAVDGVRAVQVTVNGKPADLHGWSWTEPQDRNSLGDVQVGDLIGWGE